ncbi:hypothetical protein [Streptomyces kebangsaanensis]|uniref:hypothetical protein n=1 Tax=Streptomyces kebangsaanensis TaxID=864058 RepID=UPI000AA5FE2C|nr:hypothetical protein [Streptomyces kebangsaanensis]
MIMTRSSAITAAVAAAAALTATGITYATAAPASAPQTAPAVVQQAPAPAQAPMGGEGGQGKGGGERGEHGEHGEGGERGERGHHRVGRIFINERSFSAHPDGCITVVSGLGSKSFNIRNDSKRTVEFFRGATCDNGAPVATVGPHSEANGVRPGHVEGVFVEDGVVGSFRVIHRHYGKDGFDFDFDF